MPATPKLILPPESMEWGRWIQDQVSTLASQASMRAQGENMTNNTQASTIRSLQQLVGGLQTQVAAAISANSYTAATIDSKIANPGTVTATGTVRANAGLYSTDAYSFNLTGTRVTGWHGIDGHVATASSSIRFKTNVVDSDLVSKAEAILGIQTHYYNYKAEIAKRDDPTSDGYVGPDYQVHLELGMIAEELHAAGLWEFVVYERDPVYQIVTVEAEDGAESQQQVIVGDTLRLDENGQPIPYSIHYELFAMGVLAAAQYLFGLYKAQQAQIDALTDRLDKAGIA